MQRIRPLATLSGGLLNRFPFFYAATLAGMTALANAAAADDAGNTSYVSARLPIIGRAMDIGANRSAGLSPTLREMTPVGHPSNTWTKLANLPNAVVHDVAFGDATTGYAAAEEGQIWETTNGGQTWSEILNRGYPYYYYGIYVSGKNVVASGFNDSNSEAILSGSKDGGKTWSADTVLSSDAWAGRVQFTHRLGRGLAMSGEGLANPNAAWTTIKPNQWVQNTPDPSGGWFGYQFTLLKDQTAYASGINYCKSADTGATWSCAPPADSVYDGPTEFVDDEMGWTGGGEISPDVAGWLHRTANGGKTWSGRVLNSPWPIREIKFLSKKIGWAAGGNIYSNVGGIYYSADGGKTWSLDISTGDEVGSCAEQAIGDGSQSQVWCVGDAYNGASFSSNVYSTVVATP